MQRDPSTEKWRFNHPTLGFGDGNDGCFMISRHGQRPLAVISSDGDGWDHVSVSTQTGVPTWDEMNYVKDLFFGPEDVVMQLHPAKSQYKNCHPFCLHLWRPQTETIPTPPNFMVAL